jgi:MoaA/NifB/PqqE/SkfB family radical SAM enzyme
MANAGNAELINENKLINGYECMTGKVRLKSTPQYVTIGAHYRCNAKCVFCLGGNYPEFDAGIYKTFFEKKLLPVLKNAEHVGFCGFGETLLMPGGTAFLDYINETLPDNIKNFTTNGIALKPPVCERLAEGRYAVIVSLHASNKKLHQEMTGTKAFDTILERIRHLVRLRDTKNNALHINLVFLLTSRNIDDLPSFVQLGADLGVDRVTCNYLTIYDPAHLPLSCFFQKEKTNRIFDAAQKAADARGIPLILPLRFGKHAVVGGAHRCYDPWNFFYVETQSSVNPCCLAGEHIGYLKKNSFDEIWNGAGYTKLRTGMISGRVHNWCKYCYKNDPNNINDIRSHITFRPGVRESILAYVRRHADEFPGF